MELIHRYKQIYEIFVVIGFSSSLLTPGLTTWYKNGLEIPDFVEKPVVSCPLHTQIWSRVFSECIVSLQTTGFYYYCFNFVFSFISFDDPIIFMRR